MTGTNREPVANLQEEEAGFFNEDDLISYVIGFLRGDKTAYIYLSCPNFRERMCVAMRVWKGLKKGEARKIENNVGITIYTKFVDFFVPMHDDEHYNKDRVTHFLTWVCPSDTKKESGDVSVSTTK